MLKQILCSGMAGFQAMLQGVLAESDSVSGAVLTSNPAAAIPLLVIFIALMSSVIYYRKG